MRIRSYTLNGIKICILYMPRSRDDVHIVSTETVRDVQGNAQIYTMHSISVVMFHKSYRS